MAEKLLGLDYGIERVGIAVSYGTLAEPLLTAPNDEALFDTLSRLASEHNITRVVLGLSEQAMAEKTKKFGGKLRSYLQLPIDYEDEALSSAEVQAKLRDRFQGKQQYRGPIDHFAAALILERYMDDHPETTA